MLPEQLRLIEFPGAGHATLKERLAILGPAPVTLGDTRARFPNLANLSLG